MSYDDLIRLYFERSTALQWYWTIYVVVIGGLLAFSSIRKEWNPLTTVLITVLYCFFAYKNLDAIHDVSDQRAATVQLIKQSADSNRTNGIDVAQVRKLLEPTLVSLEYGGVRNFHIASDVLTLAALWAMEFRRRKAAKDKDPSV